MCYKWCRMFSRNLTAPEALRHYADTRTKVLRHVADYLDTARRYGGAYREYYARRAVELAQPRINLLEFLLNHVEELPTDAATIEVLRKDLADMKSKIDTAKAYTAARWASFPK